MSKTAEAYFYEFRASADTDAAMSLLRSRDALLYLALMAAHLGEGQIVDGPSLAALIAEDLAGGALSQSGPAAEDGDAARDPDAILRRWTQRGWVHRSIDHETRTERYQLTAGAHQAVQQMRSVQRHSSTATQSALAMVMSELRQIAVEASPDPEERAQALRQQIEDLDAQLAAVTAGEARPATSAELADRIAALSQLIDRIPADVARYGERMHANTAALLRQSLAEDAAEFADTLGRMFEGHDVIAGSPEGLAFRAFTNLIGMPSQRARLETDISEILDRVPGLPAHLTESLGTFIDRTWLRVQEVEGIRKAAFRRISNFVRGGDATHYRGMRTRVAEAQAAAAGAFLAASAGRDTGFAVPLGGLVAESAGRLRLDEGTAARPDALPPASGDFAIDPASLASADAVDMDALRAAASRAMDTRGGLATLPEVLAELPGARAGDVIGLWLLATRHGEVDDSARVTVTASTRHGLRAITLPYLAFTSPLPSARPGPRRPPRQAAGQLTLLVEEDSDQ
jgi:uncharacterized small protein (DUF1192 family)